MSEKQLDLVTLKGSFREAGASYGKHFYRELAGFMMQEVAPTPARRAYAKRCWEQVRRYAPASAAFMRGMSRGSGLSVEEVTLLSLHEEIIHQMHCSAIAATGAATQTGHALIAQNWDWKSWRFPWAGLLRLQIKGAPRMLTYHYPGLWASLGVNQHGLSLVWTGGGYWPRLKPKVGIPTYSLIFEILQLKTVDEALKLLEKNQHAGCFLFFLGDAKGNIAVVEGIPGRLQVDRSQDRFSRANHYECPDIVRASRQRLPPKKKSNTRVRGEIISKLLYKVRQHSVSTMQSVLTSNKEIYGFEKAHMTIDSFVIDCRKKTLFVSRGGHFPGKWRTYRV
jgi:isopenicillin-N N-acyltransferase like protein